MCDCLIQPPGCHTPTDYFVFMCIRVEERRLVGTISHVYRDTGSKLVTFSVHGQLTSVGRCDYYVAGTTVRTDVGLFRRTYKPNQCTGVAVFVVKCVRMNVLDRRRACYELKQSCCHV